ncbi:hypothetical protein [Agromyces italicus]|uniref:hypothetical protein n=1 Tax=Agromyces italicus TaxID=279572 RepID=UPI0003B7322C|nr:hypothetical protein [Agromyces italicus]
MTLDPSPAPQPAAPQPQAPQPQAPAPQHPARPRGLAGALTAAIIVSALPIIGLPLFFVWSFAVIFDQVSTDSSAPSVVAAEAEAEQEEARSNSTLVADIPIDLPWDARLGGDAYTWLVDSFPSDPEWVLAGEPSEPDVNFTNVAYENVETGCNVWFANGPLSGLDVTHGDRVASVALVQYALEREFADGEVIDGSIATVSADGAQAGVTDAVEVDLSADGWSGVAVARAFPSIGEGVVFTVGCPGDVQLDTARAQVDELLQLSLTPTH